MLLPTHFANFVAQLLVKLQYNSGVHYHCQTGGRYPPVLGCCLTGTRLNRCDKLYFGGMRVPIGNLPMNDRFKQIVICLRQMD